MLSMARLGTMIVLINQWLRLNGVENFHLGGSNWVNYGDDPNNMDSV